MGTVSRSAHSPATVITEVQVRKKMRLSKVKKVSLTACGMFED